MSYLVSEETVMTHQIEWRWKYWKATVVHCPYGGNWCRWRLITMCVMTCFRFINAEDVIDNWLTPMQNLCNDVAHSGQRTFYLLTALSRGILPGYTLRTSLTCKKTDEHHESFNCLWCYQWIDCPALVQFDKHLHEEGKKQSLTTTGSMILTGSDKAGPFQSCRPIGFVRLRVESHLKCLCTVHPRGCNNGESY